MGERKNELIKGNGGASRSKEVKSVTPSPNEIIHKRKTKFTVEKIV